MENSKRGGKRTGAGRKRQYARKITFNATEKTLEILQQQEHKAEYINQAISEKWLRN